MKAAKVIRVNSDWIVFDNGMTLQSDHGQDCCESHYLSFDDLSLEDFEGLEFDLTSDSFFRRIEDYGIELVPVKGWSVKIPGYGSNNGYYSANLSLVLDDKKGNKKVFDIAECQNITWL